MIPSLNDIGDEPRPLMLHVQTGGSNPPLFFVHGVAGNVARFNNVVRHLGPDESIYVLQQPDLRGTQAILSRVEDMAAEYIGAIQTVQPKGPYFVAGYSFGGLVSFEIAQQLHRQGHEVPLVALLDAGQPVFRKDVGRVLRSPKALGTYFRRFKELMSEPGSRATVWSRIQNELWRHFYLHFRKGDSQPLPRTTAVLNAAIIEAAVSYNPRPFPGRLSVFRVEERTMVDTYDRYLGWGGLGEGGVEVYDVPGDHVSAAEEPHVAVLVEKLKLAIRAARDNPRSHLAGPQ